MSSNIKVLVTGATGFVGSNLVRRLIDTGYDVNIISRKSSNKWRIIDLLPKLREYSVDLLDYNQLCTIVQQINPDVIFHLATLGIYGGIHSPAKDVFEANVFGTMNLINACSNVDYKCFVNTGSSSEYGPKKGAMNENDVCAPVNVYGISKCASTQYASFVARTCAKPIITFRLFSPYGPFDDKRRLIPYAITNALNNNILYLSNPNSVRDFIFIEDVVDLYLKAIDHASSYYGEIFNVGAGSEQTILKVVDKILDVSESKSEIIWGSVAQRDYDTEKWEADVRKVVKCFNWTPKYEIDEGIIESVSWFRQNISYYL